MIPAPVTRSATTVPGSGIAVGGLTPGLGGYMLLKSPAGAVSAGSIAGCGTGSAIGAADSTTGTCCTGSAIGACDWAAGDGALLLSQAVEKFSDPHRFFAEAGGAAAR